MPAMDALTAKITYTDDLDNPKMRAFLASFSESLAQSSGVRGLSPKQFDHDADRLISGWKTALSVSETFYVDPEMAPLITAAAESMPPEPLLPQDLPATHGFVLIPGGLSCIDVRGLIVHTNAVVWAVTGGEVVISLLTDKYDPVDQQRLKMVNGYDMANDPTMPRYSLVHMASIEFGRDLPVSMGPDTLIPPEYGVQIQYIDGKVVVTSDKGYSGAELQEMFSFGSRPDPTFVWLVTMWRLMQQPLTSLEDEYPSRPMRRALERQNRPDKKVVVVRLRRSAARAAEGAEIEWSHRWLRRGHWRKQWYGSGDSRVQRAIWIHPTVCGPEGKPILIREKIYSLER